jgi:hypothetical protein
VITRATGLIADAIILLAGVIVPIAYAIILLAGVIVVIARAADLSRSVRTGGD